MQKYIYQFPADLTKEDLDDAKNYGLEVLGKVGENGYQPGDWLIKGTLKQLKNYCDKSLGYVMHPDYLYKEEDIDLEDILVKDSIELMFKFPERAKIALENMYKKLLEEDDLKYVDVEQVKVDIINDGEEICFRARLFLDDGSYSEEWYRYNELTGEIEEYNSGSKLTKEDLRINDSCKDEDWNEIDFEKLEAEQLAKAIEYWKSVLGDDFDKELLLKAMKIAQDRGFEEGRKWSSDITDIIIEEYNKLKKQNVNDELSIEEMIAFMNDSKEEDTEYWLGDDGKVHYREVYNDTEGVFETIDEFKEAFKIEKEDIAGDRKVDFIVLAREMIEHNLKENFSLEEIKEMIDSKDWFIWDKLAAHGHSEIFSDDEEDELYYFCNANRDKIFEALEQVWEEEYEKDN